MVYDFLSTIAKKRLVKELQQLKDEKDFGIKATLCRDENNNQDLSRWDIQINGSPTSLYEGYVLKARMCFPERYPHMPPTFTFITKMWHPNVYPDGRVCISILHTADDNPYDNYMADCSWTAVQTVRTVCISILSILADPNIESPANVDASKEFRDDKEKYQAKVKDILESNAEKIEK